MRVKFQADAEKPYLGPVRICARGELIFPTARDSLKSNFPAKECST